LILFPVRATVIPMSANPFRTPERAALRHTVRRFVGAEVLPHLDGWERAGELPRDLHRKAGEIGLLGVAFPQAVGGGGGDLVDALVVAEEMLYAGASGGLIASLFTCGIAVPHIASAGDPDQIERWVRPTLAGELIGSLAVTEPDGGSDVAGVRTSAKRDGDEYIVNGAKTYITSGCRADFVTTVVRTGEPGAHGISLLVVERGTPGFTVSRKLAKMGWHCSDTAELSFVDCRVPAANLVGAENSGFVQVAQHFVTERLSLGVQAYAAAQRCLDLTLEWCRMRQTFGHGRSTSPGRTCDPLRRGTSRARKSSRRRASPRTRRSKPASGWPTRPCSCTAGWVTCVRPRSNGSIGTCGFWGSAAAPRRS
jgi:acyl-CoA dehydrogenase